ncbi:MAG TPA: HTH domain-containing protein [Patescibacteria group bacterium]
METLTTAKNQPAGAERLGYAEALMQIIADFSSRSQEIVQSRYGISGNAPLTLEEIGKKYSITRERVRQVIREALKKMKEKQGDSMFASVRDDVVLAIKEHGGIMEEKQLLSVMGKNDVKEAAAVRFFLECMDDVVALETKGELLFSYALPDFNLEKWRATKNNTLAVLKNEKKPLSSEELFSLISASGNATELSKDTLAYYMEVSEEIKKNAFDKWGVAKWKEISPKGTREKAYLILKEASNPMHFRDIAKKIDEFQLNRKKTHPQTVHNELIKDKNFVLVGRGIYALSEWGYKKGTVKDVIEEIIEASKQPLTREEILNKVLEIRQVKKSTIVINLNNYFSKGKNGTYALKK